MKLKLASFGFTGVLALLACVSFFVYKTSQIRQAKTIDTASSFSSVGVKTKENVVNANKLIKKINEISKDVTPTQDMKDKANAVIKEINSKVAQEKSDLEQKMNQIKDENRKLSVIKNRLNELILKNGSKVLIEAENKRLEAQAEILLHSQLEMNDAYKSLMVAQEIAVSEVMKNL